LSAVLHVLAVEDAEGGEAGGGDLDGGFDGCPDGGRDEVPYVGFWVSFDVERREEGRGRGESCRRKERIGSGLEEQTYR
jgi:hypothetical protein